LGDYTKRVGVLALQGDVAEHEAALRRVGATPVRVRRAADLEGLDALVLPGGESTTIGQLATDFGLVEPLRAFVRSGRPVWGTCAGLILLAEDAGRDQPLVGGLDVRAERNAFGRQVDSFEIDLPIAALGAEPFRAVFIRAPSVATVGRGVEVLARLDDGTIVAVRQGSILATAFHPELTGDDRLHKLFLAQA
jgi:5'-phosphate synthase pdxT subunit